IRCTYRFFRLGRPGRKVIRTLERSNLLPGMRNPVRKHLAATLLLCAATASSAAQTQPAVLAPPKTGIVSRTTQAMHYRVQGGSVKVALRGTNLMAGASGEAKIEGKKISLEIDAKFQGLEDATKFGLEYLAYVLWAVSPQGRAVNLGELTLDHGKGQVKAFTDMQTFGLIVTAEPYFAVNQPGNTVVLENVVVAGAAGEDITAKYELLGAGTYSSTNTHIRDAIFGIDNHTPRELFEARNAVRIAHVAGADKYASSIMAKADEQLRQAETSFRQKQNRSAIEAAAREATQTAEESRVMAVKQKAEDEAQAQATAEQKAAEETAARARVDAEAEARGRAEAEAARTQAETARSQAEAAKAEAERSKLEAQQAAQEASKLKQEAENAKAEAIAQQQALSVEADKA